MDVTSTNKTTQRTKILAEFLSLTKKKNIKYFPKPLTESHANTTGSRSIRAAVCNVYYVVSGRNMVRNSAGSPFKLLVLFAVHGYISMM